MAVTVVEAGAEVCVGFGGQRGNGRVHHESWRGNQQDLVMTQMTGLQKREARRLLGPCLSS